MASEEFHAARRAARIVADRPAGLTPKASNYLAALLARGLGAGPRPKRRDFGLRRGDATYLEHLADGLRAQAREEYRAECRALGPKAPVVPISAGDKGSWALSRTGPAA